MINTLQNLDGLIPLIDFEQAEEFAKLMHTCTPIDIGGYQYQTVQVGWSSLYGGSARVVPLFKKATT